MEVTLSTPILFDNLIDVTPSDTAELAQPGYVMHTDTVAKDICFVTMKGQRHTVTLAPKETLYVRVRQIRETGTTATAGTVKLYV